MGRPSRAEPPTSSSTSPATSSKPLDQRRIEDPSRWRSAEGLSLFGDSPPAALRCQQVRRREPNFVSELASRVAQPIPFSHLRNPDPGTLVASDSLHIACFLT